MLQSSDPSPDASSKLCYSVRSPRCHYLQEETLKPIKMRSLSVEAIQRGEHHSTNPYFDRLLRGKIYKYKVMLSFRILAHTRARARVTLNRIIA